MKVYHLSSAPFSGGAARAGFRLHEGLLAEPGVESVWLDPGAGAIGPSVQKLAAVGPHASFSTRLRRRRWSSLVSKHFAPTTPPASNPIGWGSIEMLAKLPVPDVWNLHWVSWFLDWESMLPWMAERAPIVWTLHDLNPLQGVWHYTPQIAERTPVRMALEDKAKDLKRRALSRVSPDRLTFVGPSRWIAGACSNCPVTSAFPVKNIAYGLDTSLFLSRDPAPLRDILGIAREAPVIGFIADNLNDPRKGMDSLQRALVKLSQQCPHAHLITVGSGRIDSGGLPHSHLGPIHSDRLLSFFYSTCDLFVCPSLEDNLPNTVLESLACGTPVVAYAIGGMPDMIDPGVNGLLVEPVGDPASLAVAVESIIRKQTSSPSEWPPFEFAANRQAKIYLQLYSSFT